MFSLEDKIFIVQQWHSSHSLAIIRRSFRQRDARYHGKNLPSKRMIQYVIDNFQQHGTVVDRRKSYIVNRARIISPGKHNVLELCLETLKVISINLRRVQG